MYLKNLSIEETALIYEKYMVVDFPPEELKPLARIQETMKTGLCSVLALMEEAKLCGYAVFIHPADGTFLLLDYFAIMKDLRGKGYGHLFFEQIRSFCRENKPAAKGFFIESEKVFPDGPDYEIRTKRIDFYKNCGCTLTNFESTLFGVTYSIFYFSVEEQATPVTLQHLDYIYQTMFKKEHYAHHVKLWEI